LTDNTIVRPDSGWLRTKCDVINAPVANCMAQKCSTDLAPWVRAFYIGTRGGCRRRITHIQIIPTFFPCAVSSFSAVRHHRLNLKPQTSNPDPSTVLLFLFLLVSNFCLPAQHNYQESQKRPLRRILTRLRLNHLCEVTV
jgi:hypothetical protein